MQAWTWISKMDCITTDFVIDPYRTANENMKLQNIGQVVSFQL